MSIYEFDEMPAKLPEEFDGTVTLWSRVSLKKGGQVVEKGKWQQAQSFVRNLIYNLEAVFTRSDVTAGGWNTSNSLEGFETGGNLACWLRGGALPNDETYGIQVGTDNTAVTIADYALGTLIADGSGAGQLLYGDCQTLIPFEDDGDAYVDIVIIRQFENQSGGDITVQEIGFVVTNEDSGGANEPFLIARDLKNFTITDGLTAVVEYRMRFTT